MAVDSFGTVVTPFPPQAARKQDAPRQLPQNEEAEQALLGAILLDNKAHERVSEFLRPEHFFVPVHGRIYEAAETLIERGQIASPVTLKAYFQSDADLAHLGGGEYLADLVGAVVTIRSSEDFGRQLHDLYLRRQLIALGEEVVTEAEKHVVETNAMDQIESAEKRLYDLATTGDITGGFQSFSTALKASIERAEAAWQRTSHVSGVTTGLRDLDMKLGGLQPSDLVILAGRPSMGKTALATNLAFSAATAFRNSNGTDGAVVGFFSLEMSAEQLATRILAEASEIPSEKIRKGDIRDTEFRRLVDATQRLSAAPLFIDDTPALTIAALRTRARRLQRQSGLGMIVVDYLQLLRGSAKHAESRVMEISEITRGLKALAKELNVPVLALSQLSRAVEQREDKRPQLSDLRESGSIEQDADVVMFVFREEYYLEREEPTSLKYPDQEKFNDAWTKWRQRCENTHGTAEVIIGKQRHGPIGTVKLYFDGSLTRFADLDSNHTG
jgi:replicative DNA helicase